MKKFIFIMAAALLLGPGLASAEEVAEIVAKLQKSYEAISTVTASFTQETSSRGMKAAQTAKGKVWFKKPGKMRWEYTVPEGDLIVSDGKKIWLYQPDLNQVIEKEIDSSATRLTTDFLSGIGDITKDFKVSLASSEAGSYRLSLVPREEQPNIKRLTLEVDKTSFVIKKTAVVDNFGNETRVELKDIKTNASVQDKLFKFSAPKGAQVVRP
ncbi:MAG TPA: outer membrane lipoprotein chaperone LolA [Thermodesulfobacteriota bacterium]